MVTLILVVLLLQSMSRDGLFLLPELRAAGVTRLEALFPSRPSRRTCLHRPLLRHCASRANGSGFSMLPFSCSGCAFLPCNYGGAVVAASGAALHLRVGALLLPLVVPCFLLVIALFSPVSLFPSFDYCLCVFDCVSLRCVVLSCSGEFWVMITPCHLWSNILSIAAAFVVWCLLSLSKVLRCTFLIVKRIVAGAAMLKIWV